jgi:hypothetical protein
VQVSAISNSLHTPLCSSGFCARAYDCGREDDLLLVGVLFPTAGPRKTHNPREVRARISEVLPVIGTGLQMRLSMFIEWLVSSLLVDLKAAASRNSRRGALANQ